MKNPAGYGSVYRLPGNRRRPWCVRITVAHIENHWKYRYLGYYKTQAEAMMALAEYNRSPYDLTGITLGEAFTKFIETKEVSTSGYTLNAYHTAFNNTKPIHNQQLSKLKLATLQLFFDTLDKHYASKNQAKLALSGVYKWAMKYEIVQKNYAQLIDISKDKANATKHEKRIFTADEIKKLWSMADNDKVAEIALVLIYTGLRISELLSLKSEDVNLGEKCLYIRKSKTAAGIRTVPVADCILPFLRNGLENELVMNPWKMTINNFRDQRWKSSFQKYGMTHTIHETRHTFISLMAEVGIDERITKSIVGHVGGSITESVYTHINLEPMLTAVNKLPVYKY